MPQRIDPDGYFDGQRMRNCSDTARLLWPPLYLAANGLGRLELDCENLIYRHFRGYKNPPTEEQLMASFMEYRAFHLAFLYESSGRDWAQFWIKPGFAPEYVLKRDRSSPEPPANEFRQWLVSYPPKTKTLRKFFEDSKNFLEVNLGKFQKIPYGLGCIGLCCSGLGSVERDSLSQPVEGDSCYFCGEALPAVMGPGIEPWVDVEGRWAHQRCWENADGDSATEGGDAHDSGHPEHVAGGGSQAEAGPPLICPKCGSPEPEYPTAALLCGDLRPCCFEWLSEETHRDSHEPGQSSVTTAGTGISGTPSAGAAPLHGAGDVTRTTTPAAVAGEAKAKSGVENHGSHGKAHPSTGQPMKPLDGEEESRPAPTPTDDPLFNRLYVWFTSKRIGGSCKNVNMALQQFMSLREVLIEKLRWNPRTFEASWVKNGWDAAFASGRQAGELQTWLRDYDPDGMVQWKKGGARSAAAALEGL